jgi:hypothetical protein
LLDLFQSGRLKYPNLVDGGVAIVPTVQIGKSCRSGTRARADVPCRYALLAIVWGGWTRLKTFWRLPARSPGEAHAEG